MHSKLIIQLDRLKFKDYKEDFSNMHQSVFVQFVYLVYLYLYNIKKMRIFIWMYHMISIKATFLGKMFVNLCMFGDVYSSYFYLKIICWKLRKHDEFQQYGHGDNYSNCFFLKILVTNFENTRFIGCMCQNIIPYFANFQKFFL